MPLSVPVRIGSSPKSGILIPEGELEGEGRNSGLLDGPAMLFVGMGGGGDGDGDIMRMSCPFPFSSFALGLVVACLSRLDCCIGAGEGFGATVEGFGVNVKGLREVGGD